MNWDEIAKQPSWDPIYGCNLETLLTRSLMCLLWFLHTRWARLICNNADKNSDCGLLALMPVAVVSSPPLLTYSSSDLLLSAFRFYFPNHESCWHFSTLIYIATYLFAPFVLRRIISISSLIFHLMAVRATNPKLCFLGKQNKTHSITNWKRTGVMSVLNVDKDLSWIIGWKRHDFIYGTAY